LQLVLLLWMSAGICWELGLLRISGSVGGHMNGGGHFRVFHCYGDIWNFNVTHCRGSSIWMPESSFDHFKESFDGFGCRFNYRHMANTLSLYRQVFWNQTFDASVASHFIYRTWELHLVITFRSHWLSELSNI
jgi:hypothetical protein